ncbi:Nif3-like dinuclear metal center hexameric protein [Thorsellia anophelis]|uniref:Nif3-like dinuclear metal center hexameric protein n=1 Tax=Thorsellia anophelis TaxID=336804 RepID=UPI000B8033BE|nr:Nif3-like dinuclear metal center hexameric protein [Thorsellia anophelis]
MTNYQLQKVINEKLNIVNFNDYAPNGLQVEGASEVRRIVTGVTASEALIDKAIELNADTLLVHHGYFWKGENPIITGMKKNRLAKLIKNDINLLAYHLPLDAHEEIGNNVQLANRFGIEILGEICPLVLHGKFDHPLSWQDLSERIDNALERKPLHSGGNVAKLIQTVAWCTGGGQGFIEQAAEFGVDAFISGEVSEKTIHIAREMGLHFFAAGHHATERYGIKALGEWLEQNYSLEVIFVDIDNPA